MKDSVKRKNKIFYFKCSNRVFPLMIVKITANFNANYNDTLLYMKFRISSITACKRHLNNPDERLLFDRRENSVRENSMYSFS